MQQHGPILFIDDDPDDQFLYRPLFEQIIPDRKVVFLDNGQEAIDYLRTTEEKPFLIISELTLSGMSGLELRKEIEQDPALRKRAIPFIFFTHPVYKHLVEEAYELTIQGFFEKKPDIQAVEKELRSIIDYWSTCLHPNRFDGTE
ncbi:response regulator [Spirosoma oryzicola]|uniref:response regulator n=1 Tax=Spirosoma oryzicola TaxID=2898794 RepID=UPI001E52C541|nr:response regulator [Spirosoma oryzicola]UHG94646.1 response regulator [Spirosoma oryzicola]